MKTIERQDRTCFRLDPINAVGIASVGHRKYADGIGAHYQSWIQRRDDRTVLRGGGHCARRFSITCHSWAKAWPPADLPAKVPTGARRAAIVSTTLAIGMTGQSGWRASASA